MHDTLQADWKQPHSTPALACVVGIAACLGVGMVAAGGAMSAGFGAFQRLGRSRTGPMFWGAIGMSVFTLIGSVIGHATPAVILNALAAGLFYGWMTALGPGASWIALQCGAFALVVLFAWICYSVMNVNYGAFSISVTAYLACLLAFAGLPEKEVALYRVVNTFLASFTIWMLHRRRRDVSGQASQFAKHPSN